VRHTSSPWGEVLLTWLIIFILVGLAIAAALSLSFHSM
jgi:hypothetical protein